MTKEAIQAKNKIMSNNRKNAYPRNCGGLEAKLTTTTTHLAAIDALQTRFEHKDGVKITR